MQARNLDSTVGFILTITNAQFYDGTPNFTNHPVDGTTIELALLMPMNLVSILKKP
jgi:hypothetical protein